MMKRLYLSLLFLLGALSSVSAQEVFRFEFEQCRRVLRSGVSGFVENRLTRFQHQALSYLQRKSAEPDFIAVVHEAQMSEGKWLDRQAYFLGNFLSLYYCLWSDEAVAEAEREEWKGAFRDATLAHPAFGDPDEKTTLHNLNSTCGSFTPFSLDTEWKCAFEEIYRKASHSPSAPWVERYRQIHGH